MSSDTAKRHVADWVRALYDALDDAEPHSATAIRKLAGKQTSFIALDAEIAQVAFQSGAIDARRVESAKAPTGRTDSQTVADILGGYVEVSQTIVDGRLDIQGSAQEVIAIASIIEVLVSASTRIPEMQALSDAFLSERTFDVNGGAERLRQRMLKQRNLRLRERSLLARENLLNSR